MGPQNGRFMENKCSGIQKQKIPLHEISRPGI
jgi:hypothetical protein